MENKRKKVDDQKVIDYLREETKGDKLISKEEFYQFLTREFDIWQPYRILVKLRDKDKVIMVSGRYIKYTGLRSNA